MPAKARYCIAAYDNGTSLVFSATPDNVGELPFSVDLQAALDELVPVKPPVTPPNKPPTPGTPPAPAPVEIKLNPLSRPYLAADTAVVYAHAAIGNDANPGTETAPVKSLG